MAQAAQPAGKFNVFISYSRDDLAFADQLDAALGLADFETTIDRHGILPGEDWKERLETLIRDADTIVFVLSPSSANSPICLWEVEEAVRLGKRILPVPCRPLDGAKAPQQLADLDYIFFYPDPKSPDSGWGTGLVRLASALTTNLDWLRRHTNYLRQAHQWEAGGKPANRLLSGGDITEAKDWAADRPKNAPEPTTLQLDFIKASEAEDIYRQSVEAKRLREIAQAQAERGKALAERENALKLEAEARQSEAEAQKREAEQAKRVAQRTLVGAAVAFVLAAMVGWFGLTAHWAAQTATLERDKAFKATRQADDAREKTQRQLERANQAIAESINNDLNFEPDKSLTGRQRVALWRLAIVDEPVKSNFVSILASSPEETVRASPGFAQILRALGLLRPSASEAQSLFAAAIGGLQTVAGGSTPSTTSLRLWRQS